MRQKKINGGIKMEERIIDIIEELTGYEELRTKRDIDLLENDILDSLAFIELINTLNDEFNIEIQPTQVTPTTWRTIEGITKMVEELQKQ